MANGLKGRRSDATTTSGWKLTASAHKPIMGPVTALARIEKLDYDTVPRFALHAKRQSAGARVRVFRNVTAQISVVHHSRSAVAPETAMDVALTYSMRLR